MLILILLACTTPADTDTDTPEDTGDTGLVDPDGRTEAEFIADFVATSVQLWPGTDYTYGGDGSGGIDGAGTVYATLQHMGYQVQPTTTHGLVEDGFGYTVAAEATHEQLTTQDYSALLSGDLLVLDYDFDGTWDHVAIFVDEGQALTASDYFDEVVLADLSSYDDPLVQDLTWSSTTSRRLSYASIEPTFSE